jgi:hypothetical protein
MRNNARRLAKGCLLVVGLGLLGVAVARMPHPGKESGSWDYVNSAGVVVGSGWMDCSGAIHTSGVAAGRMVNMEIERCN